MTSQTSIFRDKVQQLEQELAKVNKTIEYDNGGNNHNIMTIAAVLTPIVLFSVLFFFTPNFMKVKSGGKSVRSYKKIFLYNALFSSLIWGIMYGCSKYTTI